jgi:hypothetical protein
MAEVVLLAMGSSELAYLRWAAGKVLGALKSRIDGFAEAIEAGQQLDPADLSSVARQCGPYLDAEDPVTALMAAQIFCLWTLRGGPGIGADLADRVATALDRGRALRWPDN